MSVQSLCLWGLSGRRGRDASCFVALTCFGDLTAPGVARAPGLAQGRGAREERGGSVGAPGSSQDGRVAAGRGRVPPPVSRGGEKSGCLMARHFGPVESSCLAVELEAS